MIFLDDPSITRRRALALMMAAVPNPVWASPRWDAVLDPARGDTIAAALARADGRPFSIRLLPGVFAEKLTITTPNVTIAGAGPASVISYGAASGLPRPEGGNW